MSRYIDADGIQYTMLYKENWITNTGLEKQGVWKDDIDKIPTADVRENVKGEWVQDEIAKKLNVYLCSNCNIPTQIVDSDGNTKLTRYCPNCGADMRGEA